jgi:hypothetical protein
MSRKPHAADRSGPVHVGPLLAFDVLAQGARALHHDAVKEFFGDPYRPSSCVAGYASTGCGSNFILHGTEFSVLFLQIVADALDIRTEIQIVPKLDGIREARLLLTVDDESADIPSGRPAATSSCTTVLHFLDRLAAVAVVGAGVAQPQGTREEQRRLLARVVQAVVHWRGCEQRHPAPDLPPGLQAE